MVLLPLLAVMALVLKCNATVRHGPRFPLNRVGFDSEKLIECAKKPTTQTLNAGEAIEIQSPKYPKNYPKTKCGWKLQVIGTDNITVSCSGFEMEKPDKKGICKDFLQIGDKKFCGKNGPKEVTINVKNSIELNFASNKKKSGSGFSCTVKAQSNEPPPCSPIEFQCAPGECIPIWYACDGITDCSNGLDEIDCPPPCNSLEFRCKPGECIPIWHDCDGIAHCSNELDNFECPPPCNSNEFRCQPGECIPIEWDCDGITDCSNALDQFDCPKKWSDVRDACIKGNNNNEFPGVTIDECKEKCVNEESYICQSIEYYSKDQGCYLSEATSSSSDFHVPCFVSGWQYMEILQDPCETDKEWSDIRNACIKGNNNQDFKGVSIDVCKEKCFKEDSFNCQSIEYRSSDKWCFLSEAKSNSLDYNVPCYVDGWIYTERLREGCITAVCVPECLNNGICVGPDECRCQKEWTGDHCETALCEPTCLNNGTCIGPNKCDCQRGWEGDHCETAICDPECLNNGTCIGQNECECQNGWEGDHCQTIGVSFILNNETYADKLKDEKSPEFVAMKKQADDVIVAALNGSERFEFELTAFTKGPSQDICTYINDDKKFVKVIGEIHEKSFYNISDLLRGGSNNGNDGMDSVKSGVDDSSSASDFSTVILNGNEVFEEICNAISPQNIDIMCQIHPIAVFCSDCSDVPVVECKWYWKCPENRPLLIKDNDIFHPTLDGDFRYRLEENKEITMACPGSYKNEYKKCTKNKLSKMYIDPIDFRCGSNGMLYQTTDDTNTPHRIEDMECDREISPTIKLIEKEWAKCSEPRHQLYEIGFQVRQGDDVKEPIYVCFDSEKKTTIWVKHTLHGKSLSAKDKRERPSFKTGFNQGLKKSPHTVSIDCAYKKSLTKIKKLLGYVSTVSDGDDSESCSSSEESESDDSESDESDETSSGGSCEESDDSGGIDNSDEYVFDNTNYYLARGHMAANGDFATKAEQDATFFYINALPQWQAVNNGNWKYIENKLRTYETEDKFDLEIISGGFGVLQMKKRDGNPTDIFLGVLKEKNKPDKEVIPVPAVTWKIVYKKKEGQSNDKEGIAFVVINNPWEENYFDGLLECSKNKPIEPDTDGAAQLGFCEKHNWMTDDEAKKYEKGLTFCCTIGELVRDLSSTISVPDIEGNIDILDYSSDPQQ